MFLGLVHYLSIIFMFSHGQNFSLYAYIFIIIKLLPKHVDSLVLCIFWLYPTLNDNIDSRLAKNISNNFSKNPESSNFFRMIFLFCFVCLGNWNYEKEKQQVFRLNWTLVFNTKGFFVMATLKKSSPTWKKSLPPTPPQKKNIWQCLYHTAL